MPLPSAEDWLFRVKVISSTSNLPDDIFNKAIHGLVKICFPDGMLEEFGIDLLAQHMREDQAPAENLTRMRSVFSSEVTECVSRMVTEYLDTPTKIKSAIRSIIGASTARHADVEDECLGNIVQSLSQDAERSPAAVPASDSASPKDENAIHGDHYGDVEEMIVDAEDDSSCPPRPKKNATTNKKVSSTWRWHIETTNAKPEALKKAFKRPSDLFAYHALPIARNLLAATATQRELRLKIQEMLDDMPSDVYDQWSESFLKLQEGDDMMLVRVPPEPERDGRTAATPAPRIGRGKLSSSSLPEHYCSVGGFQIKYKSQTESCRARLKQEAHAQANYNNFQANTVPSQHVKASKEPEGSNFDRGVCFGSYPVASPINTTLQWQLVNINARG